MSNIKRAAEGGINVVSGEDMVGTWKNVFRWSLVVSWGVNCRYSMTERGLSRLYIHWVVLS